MLREIGSLDGTLVPLWNRSHYNWDGRWLGSKKSWVRACVQREIRSRLRCNPKGGGHRAWKRVDAIWRGGPGILIWPDYAIG